MHQVGFIYKIIQGLHGHRNIKLYVECYVLTHSPFEIFVWQKSSETSIKVIHLEYIEIKYVTVFKFSDTLCNVTSSAIV